MMDNKEPLSIGPFELKTEFSSNHIYTLAEATNVARANPGALFVHLNEIIYHPTLPADRGIESPKMGQAAQRILDDHNRGPLEFHGVLPVLVKNKSDETEIIFLSTIPFEQIPQTDRMFPDSYYEDFERNPEGNKKLSDSLPIFEEAEEWSNLAGREFKVALLGNSYSGNYLALVSHLKEKGVAGKIVVMDYNRKPLEILKDKLETLRNEGVLTERDSSPQILQTDLTGMPFSKETKFDLMYGDLLLHCLHPTKIADFFQSISQHLSPTGVIFLSVPCNGFFQTNNLEDIPFVFSPKFRELHGQIQEQYYKATYSFYEKLAAQNGLKFRTIKQEGNLYWLAVTHL